MFKHKGYISTTFRRVALLPSSGKENGGEGKYVLDRSHSTKLAPTRVIRILISSNEVSPNFLAHYIRT